MHPILFSIGSFEVSSWRVAIIISVVVGVAVAMKRAPRFEVTPETILDLACLMFVVGLAGSGLWAVVSNMLQHGTLRLSGFSSTGGIVLGLLAAYAYVVRKHLKFVVVGDVCLPSFLLLAVAITRLGGCFLAGCCFGKPTNSVLGVVFPPEGHLGPFPQGTPLWPTQLFTAALGLTGFFLVLWIERRSYFPGSTFSLVLVYYAIQRFIVDQFRYYPPSQIFGTVGPFTINVNHLLIGGLFVLSTVFWIRGWRQHHRSQPHQIL
jgi:phosphatidylglycerol:prolipoprotein diacylglycerol transferase